MSFVWSLGTLKSRMVTIGRLLYLSGPDFGLARQSGAPSEGSAEPGDSIESEWLDAEREGRVKYKPTATKSQVRLLFAQRPSPSATDRLRFFAASQPRATSKPGATLAELPPVKPAQTRTR